MSDFKSHSTAIKGGDVSRSNAADMLTEGKNRSVSIDIEQAKADIKQYFYNFENKKDLILEPDIRSKIEAELISGKYRAIMPMYHDITAVNTVNYMIEVLKDPKNVTVVNGGFPHDDVSQQVAKLGVEVLEVNDLRKMIPAETFYDILCWNEKDKEGKIMTPKGKGISLFWLHLYDEVVRKKAFPEETVTLQIDSDIANIGVAPDKYNPLYYLVLPWVLDPDKKYIHTMTSSPGRNNESMMSLRNALQAIGDAGMKEASIYAYFMQRLKWMLSGEFAFGNRQTIRDMPHASGYGAETILTMYLALEEKKGRGNTAQVAIRIPRMDASNSYTKEYVIYNQLSYLMLTLSVRPSKPGSLEAGQDIDSLKIPDVKEINARMAKRDYFTIIGEGQGPCEVISTVNDRIIPSINQLVNEGCLNQKAVGQIASR